MLGESLAIIGYTYAAQYAQQARLIAYGVVETNAFFTEGIMGSITESATLEQTQAGLPAISHGQDHRPRRAAGDWNLRHRPRERDGRQRGLLQQHRPADHGLVRLDRRRPRGRRRQGVRQPPGQTYVYDRPGRITQSVYPATPTQPFVTNSDDSLSRVQTQTNILEGTWQYFFAGSRSEEVDPYGMRRLEQQLGRARPADAGHRPRTQHRRLHL